MLKSSLSTTIFNHFSSTYQQLNTLENSSQPFVYVDPNGSVKLLTSVFEEGSEDSDIFAISVAEDGWMEFLAVQES